MAVSLVGCGGFEQPSECAEYIDCLTEVAPGAVGEAVDQYGTEGTCWDKDDESAQLCKKACFNALRDLRAMSSDNCR